MTAAMKGKARKKGEHQWRAAQEQVPTAEDRLDALEAAIMRGVELGYER